MMGGLGVCGRKYCCSGFLSDFVQVSIKMAREQNFALNSSKSSGACGRLMCCLRYEHETYEDAIKKLAQYQLIGITDNYIYVKGKPVGEITAQRPAAQTKVKHGRKIYLTANSGKQPMITLPDIIENSSLREAESRLRAAGFQLTPHEVIPGDLDWVYGVRYNGRELKDHEQIPEGSELTIIVGGGKKNNDPIEMPDVEYGWLD